MNMQVRSDSLNQEYPKWIAEMSYHTRHYGSIELTPQITHRYHQVKDLYEFGFPQSDMLRANNDLKFFRSRAVLSWKNDTVAELKAQILKDLPCEEQAFESVNQADYPGENGDNQGAHELPIEFLQSINISVITPCSITTKNWYSCQVNAKSS